MSGTFGVSGFQGSVGGQSDCKKKPSTVSGKKKAHKHKFFGPVALGTTPGMCLGQIGLFPGTNPLCPRDKPRFSPYFTQWKPSLSLGQTQFVPGTTRGRRAAQNVYVSKVYVPFSLATVSKEAASNSFSNDPFLWSQNFSRLPPGLWMLRTLVGEGLQLRAFLVCRLTGDAEKGTIQGEIIYAPSLPRFLAKPCQRAPTPPQPRLSRVKAWSSPARGYKFGCVCFYMAGHEDAGVVTGHILQEF